MRRAGSEEWAWSGERVGTWVPSDPSSSLGPGWSFNSKPLHNNLHPHPAPCGPGSLTGMWGDDKERVEGAENQCKSAQRPSMEMNKEEINSN